MPESRLKSWEAAVLQQRSMDGIEKHRKSDATLAIVDASGKPISGAKVRISQQSHEFFFGCNSFVPGQFKEKEQACCGVFLKLFNSTTVP